MRVFLTGNHGYLGSLLAPELIKKGHEVIGLDTGFYKERFLYRTNSINPYTIVKDLRDVDANDLRGVANDPGTTTLWPPFSTNARP